MKLFEEHQRRFLGKQGISAYGSNVEITDWSLSDEGLIVDIDVTFRDCHRQVVFHEFGNTQEQALAKLDDMITALQATKLDVRLAYAELPALQAKAKKAKKESK